MPSRVCDVCHLPIDPGASAFFVPWRFDDGTYASTGRTCHHGFCLRYALTKNAHPVPPEVACPT